MKTDGAGRCACEENRMLINLFGIYISADSIAAVVWQAVMEAVIISVMTLRASSKVAFGNARPD